MLTVSGTNPVNYCYTAPSGSQACVVVHYSSLPIQTNFGVPGIAEYNGWAQLVSSIVYPDGSSYTFSYEGTPSYPNYTTGRIAIVTLPTGGSITYRYNGGSNGIFGDGTTAGFYRDVYDGTNTNTWLYYLSGSGLTTVYDPQSNLTQINFSGIYETQRQSYQLVNGTQTLQKTVMNCYNGNFTTCATPPSAVTAPITRQSVFTTLPSGHWNEVDSYFNSYGLLSQNDTYDFVTSGNPPLLQRALVTYASLGNNIVDRVASVSTLDGTGNYFAQTIYGYDETGVTTTSGTPQHVAVSGSRGNVTSIGQWSGVSGGSNTYLTRHLTYYDTGTPNTATDVNGAVTTYNYGTDLTANCNNTFPIGLTLPTGLTGSTGWNCTGAVPNSATDANNKVTSTIWNDAYFWRPAGVTDPLGNTMNIGYGGATITESNMVFNGGNSIVDSANTRDGLGRPHLSQRRQGATGTAFNTFDSVEADYDSNGRPFRSTVGYVGASTQSYCSAHGLPSNCTPPGSSTTYDALGRPLHVQDAGGGTADYNYYDNDVLITTSPSPNRQMQYEYDALGRLTSVCELTSASGSGTCGQSRTQTGYWTKYSYDAAGRLLTVTQNAQAASGSQQTRSFSYDFTGRMTSETNPESGTTAYIYDSTPGSSCNTAGYSSPGDLLRKVDANGNNSCYYYDALHRLTDVGIVSGNTVSCKRFRYDNSTGIMGSIPAGISISNPLGHMVEAETDNCAWPVTASISDEWFSYSARGEITDTWEATAHSGGYYHLNQTYWPHGVVASLSGLPSMPTIYYGASDESGVDSEGRITKVTASGTGPTPVPSVSYNNADPGTSNEPLGALLSVNLGTTTTGQYDSDSFTYYPNTGRLHTYQFSVNSQTDTGTLTWNTNGSLNSLAINDQIPGTTDNQTCNYTHDDLGRIATANCGTGQSQTFSYDPFGNIKKTANAGVGNFIVGYNQATNRITDAGYSYDNNGNLLTDVAGSSHQYSWDAEGRPTCIDGVVLTYDASGREVEQARGGSDCAHPGTSYQQIVYGPGGGKLALMTGQTLSKAFVPLPGGTTVVYGPDNSTPPNIVLKYYRHSDWLGSSRLASTPARTLYSETAYGPFGENYAGSGTTDLSFTGQNQDTVAGLYDFMFREQSPIQGRWTSPDPAGLDAVDPTDPQSWNRYAYVGNTPLTATDPLGLQHLIQTPCATVSSLSRFTPQCPMSQGGEGIGGLDSFFGGLISTGSVQIGREFQVRVPTYVRSPETGLPIQVGWAWGTLFIPGGSNGVLYAQAVTPNLPNNGQSQQQAQQQALQLQLKSDAQNEKDCEQEAKAAFGQFVTDESVATTVLSGIVGKIIGKSNGAIALGVSISQIVRYDVKALKYNGTLQACRARQGIGGLGSAVSWTP